MSQPSEKTIKKLLLATLICTCTMLQGCGTILYPERNGQAPGRIDPGVVILDGIGLLFFLVPGLVAFAVDFNNNTIYLPASGSSANDGHSERKIQLAEAIDAAKLEAVVERELAVEDVLHREDLQVSKTPIR